MKPVKISNRNIMFTQPFGEGYDFDLNTGLILGRNFNFVIDTGLGTGSVAPLFELVGENKKPFVVVNTHFHWDHIWGNCAFKESVIAAHSKCRQMIEDDWDRAVKEYSGLIDGEAQKCLPNLTFDDCLYFPEDGVKIFHTPGHSADSISVYDEVEKVLYAGDNIGDTESEVIPYIATDAETFRRTIEIYKTYGFEVCVSGHNKPQGREVAALMEAALDESWNRQLQAVTE